MKPILLCLFVGVLFSATNCKKSESERTVRNSIIGIWELRRSSGQITINYAPGNGNTLQFTKSTYESLSTILADPEGMGYWLNALALTQRRVLPTVGYDSGTHCQTERVTRNCV